RRKGAFVFAGAAVLAGLSFCAALAQSQQSDVNAYIAKAPIAGLPPGPYSQWTNEQKKTAHTRIGGFCQFLCVDAYGNASFPNVAAAERAKAEAKVCLEACIINHLPSGYPLLELDRLKQQLHSDYAKAKQLGSVIAWPLPEK
ncbi:MAG: hypothetical protein HY765_02660, partial [Rhodomicrobium sp.]|nr:hypothetical protein [Rhodomicrobium sp.]